MRILRLSAMSLGAALLALLWVELGLRGAALAWRLACRAASRPGSFAVYVLGESTAYGEPFAPRISFPRILELMFRERLRGRRLEVVTLARPGSDTEAQYWLLLRELALRPRRDGVILVYAGINESYPEEPPSRADRLADRSLLLSRLLALRRGRGGPGLGLDYEHRLARVLRLARGCGVPVVLSTLAGNLRDFQPDVSRGLLGDPARAARFERALRCEARGLWRQAAALYEGLDLDVGRDPGLMHRRARCLLELGQVEPARELFQRAADEGGTKRPTTCQDQAIRRLAARFGTGLADTRAAFAAAAPQGLPGYDLFFDAHHPNLRGYLVLAESFARELGRVLGEPVARPDLSEAEVRTETGFSGRELGGIYGSRFLWFCGEAYHRVDPRHPLRMARRYLELAEKEGGRPLPAYRFLLALVARDRPALERALAGRDALRRDRGSLGSIGCNREWTSQLVREAGLPETLRAEAQRVMDLAASLSSCGRDGQEPRGRGSSRRPLLAGRGPEGQPPSPQRRRFLESKTKADRGISLVLSGRAEEGRRELEAALRLSPENAEAALSLCAWHTQRQDWTAALTYCDQAWRAASAEESAYPPAFVDQCRDAREKAQARLRTRNPPFGGSGS
ncbi:MAG: hypothetical protein HY926_06690 [Elusimicrobia bacterium]|nr:hypothetical protein [Elusimicrobiota bacterium]